jgi:PAS domain S-box-containing protein
MVFQPDRDVTTPSLRTREALRLAIRERGAPADYLVAIVSVASAAALTRMFADYMQGTLMPLFFGAVMLTAWAGGFWPGVVATILSALVIDKIVLPAEFFGVNEVLGLVLFVVIAVITSSLNALRKYTYDVLRRQQLELELRVADRTRELVEMNRRLQEEISDRRRVQSTLLESEERFRMMFEQAPIAYHEIDKQGIIRRVNGAECELLERPADELLGTPVWELVAPEQRELSRSEVVRKLQGGKLTDAFTRDYLTKSGRRLRVEIHERAITEPSGAVAGIRSALLDITARVEAEAHIRKLNTELEHRVQTRTADLQRSNDALQQFAYSASHDLQEPLRMVASYTRLLERRYKHLFDEDGREYLHYIVDGAERMSGLIRDLLAFSRAGRVSPDPPELIEVSELLEIAKLNLQTAIEETNATISTSELSPIRCKRAGLAQVLQNLLSNSMKYRSDKPVSITIRQSETPNEWVFCVADNGIGFDPSQAERVFGVFQRLHGRNYPGSGIGLAICKRIVERNGGRIWAESSPGEGARFYFTLPRHAEEDELAAVSRLSL